MSSAEIQSLESSSAPPPLPQRKSEGKGPKPPNAAAAKRRLIGLAVAGCVLVFGGALAWFGQDLLRTGGGSPAPTPDIRPVRTMVAASQAQGEPVSLTGHVRAR